MRPTMLVMSSDSVAENSRFWRFAGRWDRIRRTLGQKPMSSMRSASSRTRISTFEEIDIFALVQVDQAPRRGHEHLDAALQALDLRLVLHAADDDARPLTGVLAYDRGDLLDLLCEFSRRGHDERARRSRAHSDTLHERQRERGGLAGARLCGTNDVATFEDERD